MRRILVPLLVSGFLMVPVTSWSAPELPVGENLAEQVMVLQAQVAGLQETFADLHSGLSASDYAISYMHGEDWSGSQVVDVYVYSADASGNLYTQSYSFSAVSSPTTPKITTTSLPNAKVGSEYSQTISATGGSAPYSWMRQFDDTISLPASDIVTSVTYDWGNEFVTGQGSDLWVSTWASDNTMLFGWGDGGGLTGTNADCRAKLGIQKITSVPPAAISVSELYGCTTSESGCFGYYTTPVPRGCDAPYASGNYGYINGLLDVEGTIYMNVNLDDAYPSTHRTYKSTNGGQTFSSVGWNWDNIVGYPSVTNFVQFGPGYANARDTYVYLVAFEIKAGDYVGAAYLARVPKASVDTESAYEWFTGTPTSPMWGSWANRTGILDLQAADGIYVKKIAISKNTGLGRYILTTFYTNTSTDDVGDISKVLFLEAPEPWGPYRVIDVDSSWGSLSSECGLDLSIPNRWTSGDGKTFYLVYSGCQSPTNYDNFRMVKATITTAPDYVEMPPGLSLNSSTGVISGMPTTPGTYNMTVRVTDANGNKDTQALSLTVLPSGGGYEQIAIGSSAIQEGYIDAWEPDVNF